MSLFERGGGSFREGKEGMEIAASCVFSLSARWKREGNARKRGRGKRGRDLPLIHFLY